MLERTPTFKRKPESKAAIRDKQQAATNGGQQTATLSSPQTAQQTPAQPQRPVNPDSAQPTIQFEED